MRLSYQNSYHQNAHLGTRGEPNLNMLQLDSMNSRKQYRVSKNFFKSKTIE